MNTPARLVIPPIAPRRFLIGLGVGVLALNLTVMLMAALSVRRSWRNHQERASASAENLAQVLDRYVASTFAKADLAVLAVKDEATRTTTQPRALADLKAFMEQQRERVPEVMALRITDARGTVIQGTGSGSLAGFNMADRDYFIRLRDHPESGAVISRPVVGKVVGQWILVLARRLEHPDHRFAGVAYATIALDQLTQTFSTLDLGAHGSVALRDQELGLVTRYPEPLKSGTAVGQKYVSPEFQAFARSGHTSGGYKAQTPFDHIIRTFSVRKVAGQPFYLAVGLAERDYLTEWRREVAVEIVELAGFIGLTLLSSWLLYRAWSRQQAAQATLEQLLAEVKTLSGMLPICSHCKKIRDDGGYWNQLEAYLKQHTDAEFSHGICPECLKEHYPNHTHRNATT